MLFFRIVTEWINEYDKFLREFIGKIYFYSKVTEIERKKEKKEKRVFKTNSSKTVITKDNSKKPIYYLIACSILYAARVTPSLVCMEGK